jgi:hypothetical protein
LGRLGRKNHVMIQMGTDINMKKVKRTESVPNWASVLREYQ